MAAAMVPDGYGQRHTRGDYHPQRFISDEKLVDQIIEESRAKHAAKEARRAARWSTSNLYNLFVCGRCNEFPTYSKKGGEYGFTCACRGYVLTEREWQTQNKTDWWYL